MQGQDLAQSLPIDEGVSREIHQFGQDTLIHRYLFFFQSLLTNDGALPPSTMSRGGEISGLRVLACSALGRVVICRIPERT